MKQKDLIFPPLGKWIKVFFFLIVLTGVMTRTVFAQEKTIKGKVSDKSGMSIPGASIIIKETTTGTVTNNNGVFTLVNVPEKSILICSFMGMKTQEISVVGKREIAIVLEENFIGLEEVVAIGYGTIKKKDLTGSVSNVEGVKIASRQTTQLSQALQGALPGVAVTRSSSEPGAGATIRIRGITTIGDSNPLIIVDGVPTANINDVNSIDIENISVLKDAASASIYGARAASGVIIITTKRAKAGMTNLEYNVSYGLEKPTEFPEVAGGKRYIEMMNELVWNDAGNNAGGEFPVYSKDKVDNWIERNKTNPNEYPLTDWKNLIIKEYATKQTHQLSISAGGERVKTKASFIYEKVGALYDYRSFERFSTRINNSVTINNYLSANIDVSFNHTINESPSINPVYSALTYPAIFAATWADGRVAEGKTGSNAYAALHYGGFNNAWGNTLMGKISLEFRPVKNIVITGVISPTLTFNKGKQFIKQIAYYDANDPNVFSGYIVGNNTTSLSETRNDGKTIIKQLLANYTGKFNNHHLNILSGYEDSYGFGESLGASRDQFALSNFPYLNLGPLDYRGNSGSASEVAYQSLFGRMIYDYNNKYLIQANIRYDGSSRFHPDYRWASFPSFSAGWVISEEKFMKSLPALSFLKLRGSWGTLGNERIGNYPYQSTIAFSSALFYQGNDIVSGLTAAQVKYAIRDISWETTETTNFGLDANFFDNRIMFTGDYYKKRTMDMLLPLEIPDIMGYSNPDQNTGIMDTEGWETQLTWRDKIGELNYSASFNLSDSKSVMGNLGGIVFLGDKITREGSEYNEWYGYKSNGLFQTQTEVVDSPVLNTSVKPGDIKYTDISGPDGVPDGKITPDYDRVLLGRSLPQFIYGGNVNLDYKGIDLSLVFQGIGKQYNRISQDMVQPFQTEWTNVPEIIDGKYWSKYNTDEQNINAKYPRLSSTGARYNNYYMSDYWLIDGAYFRLKNITLGYTLPHKIVERAKLANVRIYTSITDLFSVDNYPKGWDPEVMSTSYISQSFNFGLSIKF